MRDSAARGTSRAPRSRARRAARALGVRPLRVEPEAQRDADRLGAPTSRSATALSTPPLIATAMRRGSACARTAGPIAFASASTASVSPPTAAASSSVRPRVVGRARAHRHRRSGRRRRADEPPPSRRRARSLRTARPSFQSRREGPLGPSLVLRHRRSVPRPCEPGQARWVPCGTSDNLRLFPTRAPFHMVLVLHGSRRTNDVEHAHSPYPRSPCLGIRPVDLLDAAQAELACKRVGEIELAARHVRARGRRPARARSFRGT